MVMARSNTSMLIVATTENAVLNESINQSNHLLPITFKGDERRRSEIDITSSSIEVSYLCK